jgi:serine/threonine protein kinase
VRHIRYQFTTLSYSLYYITTALYLKLQQVVQLEAEIQVMKTLCNRHIVRYIGTGRGARHLYIFLEYVPGGSIAAMLSRFGVFREHLIKRFMHQVL